VRLFLWYAVARSDCSATSPSAAVRAVRPLARFGLWRRLLDRLRRNWRLACGDAPEPSALVIDSRSCRSAPSCFDRGIDGGKKIRGVKIHIAVDKYGIPLAIDVLPTNRHDTKGIVPVLRALADGGFQGPALGNLGYRGERLANVGEMLGINIEAIARRRDGRFVPAGICWVVERSFAWLSCYRRLNTIFERSREHLIAFVAIAFISILSRRRVHQLVDRQPHHGATICPARRGVPLPSFGPRHRQDLRWPSATPTSPPDPPSP
jgi:transposase